MQLSPAFSPLPQLGAQHVASTSAASAWFMHLVQLAEGEGQLHALACLLGLAWRHGAALPEVLPLTPAMHHIACLMSATAL